MSYNCSQTLLGYQLDPGIVVFNNSDSSFNALNSAKANVLTAWTILHPVACGITFLAFLLACSAGPCGAISASIFASLAWVLTLAALILDFYIFGARLSPASLSH